MNRFSWTNDETEAARDQATLRELVKIEPLEVRPGMRGLAIGTAYDDSEHKAIAVGVRFRLDGRCEDRDLFEIEDVQFPYIPGLLVYRVGPAICKLLDKYIEKIDV